MSIAEKIQTIVENEQLVYEAGKQSEYDKFWDAFQDYGKRTNYEYAFYNGFGGWSNWFYPKYDIVPINAANMFRYNTDLNLKEALAKNNVKLDFSQCTNIGSCFNYADVGDLPEINTKSLSSIPSCFNTCRSKKIDKFILKDDGSQIFNNTFAAYQSLQDIVFEGVIGQDLKLNSCTNLSKVSIENIVSVLSATATGKTLSISKTAKEREFTEEEWQTLIATKSNWTISLI